MKTPLSNSKYELMAAMIIYGTIGTISRYVDMPSAFMSCVRALIGVGSIFIYLKYKGRVLDRDAIRENAIHLLIAGALLGMNWVFIFEGFANTTVAVASLCYYMQPILLMLAAPLFLSEKLSTSSIICILIAFTGMMLITNPSGGADMPVNHVRGVLFSLAAAVTYTINIIVCKKMRNISAMDSTVGQLVVAGLILMPYIFITDSIPHSDIDARSILLLLLLSIIHTGIAYVLYYDSIGGLQAQTVAIMGYIDPIVSVLLSVIILKEPMTIGIATGAIMIFCSTYFGSRQSH